MKFLKLWMALPLMGVAVLASANDAVTTVKADTVQAVISPPVVEAVQKRDATVLISPRTGMRYTVENPNNIPIIFKTELVATATPTNADRIVATNPALSSVSQQKAQNALIELVNRVPTENAVNTAAQ